MSPDIADKKFTFAVRTLWVTIFFLFVSAYTLGRVAYKFEMALAQLTTDHWGLERQIRFASVLAQWNPTDPVPDPQDISDGRASVNPIAVMATRGSAQ